MWAIGLKVVASLAALSTLAVASPSALAQAAQAGSGGRGAYRVLVYGDSNTWGFVARTDAEPTTRYPANVRWPGRVALALGPGFEVVEDGMNLRTTDLDGEDWPDSVVRPRTFNGAEHLPAAIAAQMPLDLVVIMLGTNDLQARYDRDAGAAAEAAVRLARQVRAAKGGIGSAYPAPRVLLVVPPGMTTMPDAAMSARYAGGAKKSEGFGKAYQEAARAEGVPVFDAGEAIGGPAHGVDGLHLSEADHAVLADRIAPVIRNLAAVP